MNIIPANCLLTILAVYSIQACAQGSGSAQFSLDSVQGGWWSNCDDPAVAFLIERDEYFGDFEGIYNLEITGDIIVFKGGLIEGHSIHVTKDPLSFQILTATEQHLVLRPLPGNPYDGDWHLRSCDDITPQ